MNVTIYQINMERDTQQLAFMNLSFVKKMGGMDPSSYDKVFSGEVDCTNLEDVYRMFNLEHPVGYKGRSLSVSDVVEVREAEGYLDGFYFCDSVGFQRVWFQPEPVKETAQIQVVLVEPGQLARPALIPATLEGMQATVHGDIEGCYPFPDEVCIVCNESSKILGMQPNRGIRDEDGELVDIIAGTFFICDCSGEHFDSLSPEQVEKYTEMFKLPEQFFRLNGEIESVKYTPYLLRDEEMER